MRSTLSMLARSYGLYFFAFTTLCFGGDIPAPRFPAIPVVQSIEDLQMGVRNAFKRHRWDDMEAGSSLLIVTDRSQDPRLAQAFQKYAAGLDARVDVVVLNGFPGKRDPIQLLEHWGDNWWPQWLWKAATEYDYVINMTYLVISYTYQEGVEVRNWLSQHGVKSWLNMRLSVERLVYPPYAHYPEELMRAINRKVRESIPRGRVQVHLTSPEGTDLWLDNDYTGELEELEKQEKEGRFSMQVSALPTQFKNARGKIVTSSLHVGMLDEPVTLWVEDSRVRKVEGGKGLDSYLTRKFEEFDSVDVGGRGRVGIRWVEEITFTAHPKDLALIRPDDSFSGLFSNWSGGHSRSGAIHISVGGGFRTRVAPPGVKKGFHFVFELYFPTLVIGGRTMVENGHLVALDDPEVRQVAKRFGSAEEWLTEAWIPAIPGINAPKGPGPK